MNSRRDLPVGSHSRPASPFPRRPSVSTHQPPPSTPQFGREPHIAYVTPSTRPGEAPTREIPPNAPKGPKALYNNNNPPVLPSSAIAGGGGGGGGPPAHSPHKSSFPLSSAASSPHHGGHGHHYPQPGGQGPSSRGSVPPPGPRAALGRGAPAMPSAGQSRSPVSAPGSGGITTSGGPIFPSSYATSNESDRIYRGGRQRSSEWESSIGTGRGGRGRSREREYLEYGRGGASDYGVRGGGGFGGQSFRDRERDFRDGRGGYRGRSRERDIFQHRARSSSRERERGLPVYTGARCDRERSERGGFAGDRRLGFERDRSERERERDREPTRDRERERERERERLEREARFPYKPLDRDSREPRVVERSREVGGGYDLSRGDREREKRERDAAEFSNSALLNPTPSGTPPPSVPAYHGGYQSVLGPAGPSSYSSAPQQPQSRTQPYQVGNSSSTLGQWSSAQGRKSVSNSVLPIYRDKDKDYDKEKTERDVTGKVDYRDTRSDRASQPKKEPTEDGKLHSPSSIELKMPTMSVTNTSITGITPVSATSFKSYSPPPPPSQPPSGPRLGTGALPPTGPRGGLPPTGPRAGIDRESRKEVDRKWGSKERGGSVEWNTAPSPQPHQYLHPQPQPQAAAMKTPARLDVAHVHPDRIREIETADKGEDDRDKNHTQPPQHTAEQPPSFGSTESGATNVPSEVWTTPTHPSSQRASSTTLSGSSRPGSSSSSGQGFRGILNPVNGPTNSAQPTPTAPAGISSSPAKTIQPPTAPRALQASRGGAYWVRARNFRGSSFGGSIVKREVGDDSGFMGGHRNGRGGMGMMNNNMGGMRDIGRGMDRVRRSSRAGAEVERPAAREDVEMPDAHAHVRSKEEKKQEAPLKEPKGVELPETPRSLPEKREPTPEKLPPLPPPPPQTPIIKIEDPEDEEDDSLTQADVSFKIADIDRDIEALETKLAELGKRKADHVAEIAKIDKEIEHAAKAEAERSPRTMEPEVKAPIESVVEMELDKEEPTNSELQQTEEIREMKGKQDSLEQQQNEWQQQERQQQERVEQQLQQQFQQQQKQHEIDFGRSKGVLRTPSISPPPTPSASNSPISSEAESDESFPNSSSRHPMHSGLPFYRPGPPMKPPDYDFFQANIEEHESIRELLVAHISEERKATYEKEANLKRKFKDLSETWYGECREMDKESTRKKKGNSEPVDTGISPVPTAIMAPETVGRRAGRNASDVVRSEAEMEQVLKGLAEEEQQKAADTKAKDQNAREAVVPDMIMDPTEVLVFKDTNRLLRTNGDVLAAFRYNIPADDWTDTEHKVFCERYAMYPKQWGKIAQEIEDRDFKACILHYYRTKKTYSYKDLVRGPGKRGRTKGRRKAASSQRTRQSALIADLGRRGGVGEDDEGADSEDVTPAAITETGRPKRAAAPVFGIDANNNNNGSLDAELLGTGGGGKRGNKDSKGGDDDGEKAERGTKRTRGGNNAGREKQKRVKTPANVPVQPAPPISIQPVLAPVPEKAEKKEGEKKEDLRERESDAVSALAEMGAIDMLPGPMANEDKKPVIIQQLNPQIQIPVEQPPTPIQQPPTLPTTPVPLPLPATPTPKKDKGDRAEKPVAQTSSYWSVPEQSDFPHLLASFGTNWAQISQRLASKTTVMVRNFYTRQVENGKTEYKEIAEGADRKINAGEATPDPPKPAALPKKRYETTVATPRMIISNADPSATPPPPGSSGTPGPTAVASSLPSTPTPIPIQMPVQLQVQPAAPAQNSTPPPQTPVSIKEEGAVKPVMLPQLHSQPVAPQSMKPVEKPIRRPHSVSSPPHPAQLQQHVSMSIMPVQVGDMAGRPAERSQERPAEKFQERLNSERVHGGFPDRQQERMPEKFHERPHGRMHEMSNERPQERPQPRERLPDRREIFPVGGSHDRQRCVTEQMPGGVAEMIPERMPEGITERTPERAPGGVSDRMQDRLPERVQERPSAPERLFQEQSHQSPPVTPHPTAPHIHVHTRSLSQQNTVTQQKTQGQQHQHMPQRYFQELHQQTFASAPQQRPNHSIVTGPPSLEQRHQHPEQRLQNPPTIERHHNPAAMEQRLHNPNAIEQRQQIPHSMQQSHQNAPSMLQVQQNHPSQLLQVSVPRPTSAPQQLASCYQPPLSVVPQHQAPRPQTHQLPTNPTPPPSGPSSKRLTSIHSLLNPKEDPPQPRSTYYTPQTRPQTRPQTPQQQQQQHSQLQHPQPQHLPQYQPQPQPQHSQQQHLQPQSQALHTQQREPPRRELLYEQPRQQPAQLLIRGSHSLGMPNQSFQSLPRETVSYPPAPLREPASYPSAPPLRESTSQPPFTQPGHRHTLSGSHQPSQGPYSRQYSPRLATTSYPQGRGPYVPPPSIPPSSHHPQHPHHPQQATPQHPLQNPQQQQHQGPLGHQLQQQHPHYPQHNTPPPQQSQSRDYQHHPGPPDQGYYRR